MTPKEICVLIPAYNEEKNIERVAGGVLSRGYSALVVDDGSKDRTAAIARSLGVEVVVSRSNEGKGASLRKGLEHLRQGQFRAAVLIDADGQHDPAEIPRFIEAIDEGADLVIGNRMADPKRMPLVRVITNNVMSGMISAAAGSKVPDTQCGFRALSRRAIETLELRAARFETESEMILRAADAGLRIASVPVSCVYGDEKSHIRPARDTVRFIRFFIGHIASRRSP